MCVVAACFGTFTVTAHYIDANEPEYWGTFTHEYYESHGKSGQRSVGTWVSDDGNIRLEDVSLAGRVEREGTVTARYKPTGLMGDALFHTVRTESDITQWPFFTWFLLLMGYGGIFPHLWVWRIMRATRSR